MSREPIQIGLQGHDLVLSEKKNSLRESIYTMYV